MEKIYFDLMSAACRQTGLRAEEIREQHIYEKGEYIAVELLTDYQWYEIYLDAYDLNMLGLNIEPRNVISCEASPVRSIYPLNCA